MIKKNIIIATLAFSIILLAGCISVAPTATSTPKPTFTPTPVSQCPYSYSSISKVANNLSSYTRNAERNRTLFAQIELRSALSPAKEVSTYDFKCEAEITESDLRQIIFDAEFMDIRIERDLCRVDVRRKHARCQLVGSSNCSSDTSRCDSNFEQGRNRLIR